MIVDAPPIFSRSGFVGPNLDVERSQNQHLAADTSPRSKKSDCFACLGEGEGIRTSIRIPVRTWVMSIVFLAIPMLVLGSSWYAH